PNCRCQLTQGRSGTCVTCPAELSCGPVCCRQAQFCADAARGAAAPPTPGCTPESIEVACAGRNCGPASNGCGQDYDCGACGRKRGKKHQKPRKQMRVDGICKAAGGKRCIGGGLAGQPCGGKCKCKGGRRCHNGKCCEPGGDVSGSVTAQND